MESCRRSASRQSRWHTDPDTYSGTQLGQHRWVVGKQAAAGGRMDHKARPLAKFHHLLWIAWEAFSTATGGMSESHAIANPHRAQRYWRCALSLLALWNLTGYYRIKGFRWLKCLVLKYPCNFKSDITQIYWLTERFIACLLRMISRG